MSEAYITRARFEALLTERAALRAENARGAIASTPGPEQKPNRYFDRSTSGEERQCHRERDRGAILNRCERAAVRGAFALDVEP
jgi:hypothetical protein